MINITRGYNFSKHIYNQYRSNQGRIKSGSQQDGSEGESMSEGGRKGGMHGHLGMSVCVSEDQLYSTGPSRAGRSGFPSLAACLTTAISPGVANFAAEAIPFEGKSCCDWEPRLTFSGAAHGHQMGPYSHTRQGPAALVVNPQTLRHQPPQP